MSGNGHKKDWLCPLQPAALTTTRAIRLGDLHLRPGSFPKRLARGGSGGLPCAYNGEHNCPLPWRASP